MGRGKKKDLLIKGLLFGECYTIIVLKFSNDKKVSMNEPLFCSQPYSAQDS
jgi:hypothetical protein